MYKVTPCHDGAMFSQNSQVQKNSEVIYFHFERAFDNYGFFFLFFFFLFWGGSQIMQKDLPQISGI